MGKYDDIIHLDSPVSNRPKMSLEQRSAQFAPFAALTGYEGQVKETARLTDKKIEIDEEIKSILDMKIQILQEKIQEHPTIEIIYFIKDLKKDGGRYDTITNSIKKIDNITQTITTISGLQILIDDIISIEGEIFQIF